MSVPIASARSTFRPPTGAILDELGGAHPDLIFLSSERLHVRTARAIEGAPDLVVEILSRGTERRDRVVEMRRYAAAGAPHSRLLAPRTHRLEAYRLGPEGHELADDFGPGDGFSPAPFPDLKIQIEALWR